MIKSLLILVLAVLLCGGAFLSRPTEADFRKYLAERRSSGAGGLISDVLGGIQLESELKNSTFRDRYLWVTVEQAGKTAFIGAFDNFWPVGASKAEAVKGGDTDKARLVDAPAEEKPATGETARPRWPD